MVGNNLMECCQAQMVKMVQYYFDNVLFIPVHSPRVTAITGKQEHGVATFTIEMTDDKKD